MAEALLSNIGGVATLVGDPPNVVIGSAAGFTFADFLTHMAPIVAGGACWWRCSCYGSPSDASWDQAQERRGAFPPGRTGGAARPGRSPQNPDRVGAVILLFFLHGLLHLKPATIALGGAAVALLWVRPDVDETLRHVEWGVLLFFAALFVTVGGLEASGVLQLLADAVAGRERESAGGQPALALASGQPSAVVDNIPFTIAMIPVIQQLGTLGHQHLAAVVGAGAGRGLRRQRHAYRRDRQRDHRGSRAQDPHAHHAAHLAAFRPAGDAGDLCGRQPALRSVLRLDADTPDRGSTLI